MFERPEALWLLALAAPVIVLHLHYRKRRLVEVSSLELWRGLVPDRGGRGALRRIRDGVALLCLLAALTAMVAAAAGPVTGAAPSEPRRLAIVIDASASMTARTPGCRFDAALEQTAAATRRLAPRDEVSVWLATATPHLFVEPTTDHVAVEGLFVAEGMSAGMGGPPMLRTLEPPGLAKTVALARAAARGVADRDATVLVLTDAVGVEALKDLRSRDVDVRVGVVGGATAANAGIVACDVDPADANRLLVRVTTTDGPPAPREIVLLHGDAEMARKPLTFDATGGASATFALAAAAKSGGLVEVRLTPSDAFAEDDSARLILPAAKPLAVAVVAAKPSPFLVQALKAMPDVVDPERTTLVAPDAPASAFDAADVVIAEGVEPPPGRPALVFLGDGPRVALKPLLWGVGTHPVLAGVDLSPLRMERAFLLDPAPGDTVIVASAGGAVGVAAERRITFGFRPDATSLPLEAAFPLLVRNALRRLAASRRPPRYVVAGAPWPDGDGDVVPYPQPGGPYIRWTKSGDDTVLRWVPPPDFHIAPKSPTQFPSAAEAVASIPDRHADADTRQRHAPWLAAAGAALLALGALLLRPVSAAPRVVTVRPTREPAVASR